MAERVHRRPTRRSRPGLCAYRPVFHTIIVSRGWLSSVVSGRGWGRGSPEHARSHDCVRKTERSCPRRVLAWPGLPSFFFFSSPLAVAGTTKSARTTRRVSRTSRSSLPPSSRCRFTRSEITRSTQRSEAVRTPTETDGEPGNNDCNTADTCLDLRLRHARTLLCG